MKIYIFMLLPFSLYISLKVFHKYFFNLSILKFFFVFVFNIHSSISYH